MLSNCIIWRAFAAVAVLAVSMPSSADVYVSLASGEPRYATQRLDESYSLLIQSDVTLAPGPPRIPPARGTVPNAVKVLIERAAQKHQIDPLLLQAMLHTESRFNPRAVSPKGAAGVAQLMPATAKRYGVTDRHDAAQSIDAGARYLKDLLTLYKGNAALALAAYNAGEGRVDRYGKRVPPFRETMLYVPTVLTHADGLRNPPAPGAAD